MSVFARIAGVVGSLFQIGGPNGPAWKSNASGVEARNAADSAYVVVRGLDPAAAQDLVTLAYLNANGASAINLALATEPVSTCTYAVVVSAGRVTQETWNSTAIGTPLLRKVVYTYTSGKMTQEVRTVYAADGVTVTGQLTIVYTYSGSTVTSAAYTRNV
jgi:hypothetical protein